MNTDASPLKPVRINWVSIRLQGNEFKIQLTLEMPGDTMTDDRLNELFKGLCGMQPSQKNIFFRSGFCKKKGCFYMFKTMALRPAFGPLFTCVVFVALNVNQVASAICIDLKAMMKNPPYSKESLEMHAANFTVDPFRGNLYQELDIDGDGDFDDVSGSCSASKTAADGCLLSYRLSSNNETITHRFLESEVFYIILYKKKPLIIVSKRGDKVNLRKRHIKEFTKDGLKEICH